MMTSARSRHTSNGDGPQQAVRVRSGSPMTRALLVAAILLLTVLAAPAAAFVDVPADNPFNAAVTDLVGRGIVGGLRFRALRPRRSAPAPAVREARRADLRPAGEQRRQVPLHRRGQYQRVLPRQVHRGRGHREDHRRQDEDHLRPPGQGHPGTGADHGGARRRPAASRPAAGSAAALPLASGARSTTARTGRRPPRPSTTTCWWASTSWARVRRRQCLEARWRRCSSTCSSAWRRSSYDAGAFVDLGNGQQKVLGFIHHLWQNEDGSRHLILDPVQLLVGAEANAAAVADGLDAGREAPSTTTTTCATAAGRLYSYDASEQRHGDGVDLPGGQPIIGQPIAWPNFLLLWHATGIELRHVRAIPYWLFVSDGVVTAIEEQYLP